MSKFQRYRCIVLSLPQAAQKGVRIVHACGLGSVPADLSVYHMQERLRWVLLPSALQCRSKCV
jgi:short subunit dehydrogenase-like uncharacterized protein